MKLLIIGINSAPEPVGIGPYSTAFAQWLVERGHDVTMISAQPYYPAWRIMNGFARRRWTKHIENGITMVRCPLYVPAEPNGAKRIMHHASFAATALWPALMHARRLRPDVVLAVAPSLLSAPVALAAARLASARSWLHIQDFEVDAAIATGLLDGDGLAVRCARAFEASLLHRYDRVSTISPRMCERLINKGVPPSRIVEFRNWSDTDAIRPLDAPSPFRKQWGITTPHVALYSGNLANKQGIEIVVAAARRLQARTDLTFVICGEGPSKVRVMTETADLSNVQVHDLQPYAMLRDLLGLATVHLLPQVAGAADLVLPSKLTNILASRRPVVATASPETGLFAEVQGCGITTPPGDETAFSAAIVSLIDNPERHAAMSAAARTQAEERWSREAILTRVEAELADLVR